MKSNILRRTIILGLTFFMVLSFSVSCSDRFEMELPLAVASRNLKFGTASGSTHVLVYSTDEWHLRFDRKIDWASLDRVEGEGNSEFVFSYSDNYGVSRRVDVIIECGVLKDTVHMYQAGELIEPSLHFKQSEISLTTESAVSTPLLTDLVYNINDITSSVKYFDAEGNELEDAEPWISNVVVSSTDVTYDVSENATGTDRTAHLVLNITDADKISTTAIQKIVQKKQ